MTHPLPTTGQPNPTIVVVDDDIVVRGLFKAILETSGCKVFTSCNGREGMNQIRQHQVKLLVTDLVMPEQEGLETIFGVHKEFPGLKILVVSGYPEYFQTALLCGAHVCIPKPVDTSVLCRTVIDLVES